MARREPAWRVFAAELTASLQDERGTGEKAATYLISPYGARMNRVVVAGTLSSPEAIGRDPAQPFWRARLVDPTGTVAVTAGGFQPRAMAQLQSVHAPRSALVVGKAHLYRGNDGGGYALVRAESIRSIDEATLHGVLADSLRQSLDRLDLLRRQSTAAVSDEELAAEGVPAIWVRAGRASIDRYPTLDREGYRPMLFRVLEYLEGGRPLLPPGPPASPALRITRAEGAPPAARAPPTEADRAAESAFLDVVDELADTSSDGYADLKELVQRLVGHGVSANRAEELLDRLQEEGVVEEPIVGKLRRA
ncbi:MAG: hypothetical protein ACREBT_00620 [Thermoplasmata archaeon]